MGSHGVGLLVGSLPANAYPRAHCCKLLRFRERRAIPQASRIIPRLPRARNQDTSLTVALYGDVTAVASQLGGTG